MLIEVNLTDVVKALQSNKIHSSKCARFGMNDRAALYFKRQCTCWVEADDVVVIHG